MAETPSVESTSKTQADKAARPETPLTESTPSSAGTSLHRRPSARIFLIVGIIVLLVAGIFAWRYFSSYESTDDAEVDGHLMPVSARISGYVSKVNVDDNQYVHAGDVLVEIDPRDYQIAADQARAQVADAQAYATSLNINVPVTSVNTSSQVSTSEADVENARAGIEVAQKQADADAAKIVEAQANDVKAQNDLVRYKQLVDKQEVSQQTYDQAVSAAAAADASVAAAKATLAASQQQVTQARSRLAQAQASWRASQTGPQQVQSIRAHALSAEGAAQEKEAALEMAQQNLIYTKIIAPATGIVTKNVEVGMNVQPGQQLLSVVPLDDVWITANFKETQLKKMRPGQRVKIKVDSTGRTYTGKVDSLAGSSGARLSLLPPENATGNYVKVVQRVPVKIVLDQGQNSDHSLRLGMSVEPKVFLDQSQE
jgi:membrane fusion protein, multidrug efflux system